MVKMDYKVKPWPAQPIFITAWEGALKNGDMYVPQYCLTIEAKYNQGYSHHTKDIYTAYDIYRRVRKFHYGDNDPNRRFRFKIMDVKKGNKSSSFIQYSGNINGLESWSSSKLVQLIAQNYQHHLIISHILYEAIPQLELAISENTYKSSLVPKKDVTLSVKPKNIDFMYSPTPAITTTAAIGVANTGCTYSMPTPEFCFPVPLSLLSHKYLDTSSIITIVKGRIQSDLHELLRKAGL